MVQLKQVSLRLKSIKNIQKITKTMKMVSASKFMKAEKELEAARPFGYGPRKFYECTRLVEGSVDDVPQGKRAPAAATPAAAPAADDDKDEKDTKKVKRVYVAVTSDRGLCGGVHTGVARRIRREVALHGADPNVNKLVCIGDKSRVMLRRSFPLCMLINVKDIGRIAPTFSDAADIAAAIAESGFLYDLGEIYYNKYFSPIKYELSVIPFFNKERIETAPNINAFDDVDHDQLESYVEFTMAALIYFALKENSTSELSARMTAMDNATKNADDMIRDLTLLYNRTRQAVITRELVEIISGASALRN